MLKQDAANPSPHRVFPARINIIGLKYLTTDLRPLHFQMLFLKHTEHFIRKTAPHEFNSPKINHKLLVSFCIFQNCFIGIDVIINPSSNDAKESNTSFDVVIVSFSNLITTIVPTFFNFV